MCKSSEKLRFTNTIRVSCGSGVMADRPIAIHSRSGSISAYVRYVGHDEPSRKITRSVNEVRGLEYATLWTDTNLSPVSYSGRCHKEA